MYTIENVIRPGMEKAAFDSYAEIIGKLNAKIFPGDVPAKIEGEQFWWLAKCDGRPVGFLGLEVLGGKKPLSHIYRGGVLKAHEGHGLYKRMIRACVVRAKLCDASKVITYTMVHNSLSINGLIRCGFRSVDPPFRYAGSKDVCYWEVCF